MNDNTPNSKKIKIKNHLKTIFMQTVPIYFLVYFSEIAYRERLESVTFLGFVKCFLFVFLEFIIVARFFDWSSWLQKKKNLFFPEIEYIFPDLNNSWKTNNDYHSMVHPKNNFIDSDYVDYNKTLTEIWD